MRRDRKSWAARALIVLAFLPPCGTLRDAPNVWWFLRLLLPLVTLALVWIPRDARAWFHRRTQTDTDVVSVNDPSLPDGHGAVSILIQPMNGPAAPLWKDGVPHISIDGRDDRAASWGTSRLVLAMGGAHLLRIHIKLPRMGLPPHSGAAQLELIIQEKSELFVSYAPPRVPTFPGQIALRITLPPVDDSMLRS